VDGIQISGGREPGKAFPRPSDNVPSKRNGFLEADQSGIVLFGDKCASWRYQPVKSAHGLTRSIARIALP
jgi:hypothetical protein